MQKTLQRKFGLLPDGAQADYFTMANSGGDKISVTNFGATIVSIETPDRAGQPADIVLGYDTLERYVIDKDYLGTTVGRYANRIAGARFRLNGIQYSLSKNEDGQHLHGGFRGFSKVLWGAQLHSSAGSASVDLRYTSADGEEGYPGALHAQVVFTLTEMREMHIEYSAICDKDTIVNLTNHCYFNLRGAGDILDHRLTLVADHFTPVDARLIPTGELRAVDNTPFDFRYGTAIGARINDRDEQLRLGRGYDHNWVLNSAGADIPSRAAELYEPESGRRLEILTTEPGLQFYSGNMLAALPGKQGATYGRRSGLCLETQHFPDSPNQPQFPSVILGAGEKYRSTTILKFSAS